MTDQFLSVVIVSYESARELPRTLYSLSPRFQRDISADDYEVIVVDNGSARPPVASDFADLGLDLTVLTVDSPTKSPCRAVNLGLNASSGSAMGVLIDGARMASPGLVMRTREALALDPRSVVGSTGRYLGPLLQRTSMRFGYDQTVEDRLLESIDWQHNGYDLFDISVLDECSRPTWFGQIAETNAIFMSREMWTELGGYDEAFVSPGGGMVNPDTWFRACHLPGARPVVLLGESTFHQFHGGVATNGSTKRIDRFRREYVELRGHEHKRPDVPAVHWGAFAKRPPDDELIGWPAGEAQPSRMLDGPMKDLLVIPPPPATPSLRRRTRLRATIAARSIRRRLPAPVRRFIRSVLARGRPPLR
jgi:hypothetical protein